jgi:putative endonuclease
MLLCSDGSYYTGVTNDIERRLEEHKEGKDSLAYTYPRRPLRLVWHEQFQSPDAAISVEKQLKGWSRKKKQALVEGRFNLLPELSKSKSC